MNRILRALLVAGVLAVSGPALAHGPDKGPNGGQVQDVGNYHVEAVVTGGELRIYVTGADGKPVDTSGAKGSATVLLDKKQQTIMLQPAALGSLRGTGDLAGDREMRIVLSLTLPGQKPLQARFAAIR